MDPMHDEGVFLHAGNRVGPLAGRQFGNVSKARVALAVKVEYPASRGVERLEACKIVAHVIDELGIARGVRAVWLIDQQASIGGAVEPHLLTPGRWQYLVVAEHALPGRARMRRLDEGVGLIAKLSFAIGKLKLRRFHSEASGGFGAHPAMHVVVAEIL